jgi:hypothetical protein
MAGPIAIGIITVIHSRGERDFAAKISMQDPTANACPGEPLFADEDTRQRRSFRTRNGSNRCAGRSILRNGSVGWVERGETITAPMADGFRCALYPSHSRCLM